jgi:DDE family transposase
MGHKRDWVQYNKQLVNRGKINFWVNPEVLQNWKGPKEGKACRPFFYSDELIKTMTYVRFKFHLSLREAEGFFLSLIALMKIVLKEEELTGRNDAIRVIRGLGNDRLARSIWSKLVGYSRRSIAESMMSRWKRLHGSSLQSRCEQRKKVEVQIKAVMINQMIDAAA